MSDADARPGDRAEAIANYKRILRTYIDRRPSGTRQKIALALGKHKASSRRSPIPPMPRRCPRRI